MDPLVSIVIPMHDESENAASTLSVLASALEEQSWVFELLPVDDGSNDDTGHVLARCAAEDPRVHPIVYATNRGRGYAMRRGFQQARGRFVVTMDADLSYSADHAVRMVRMLQEDPEADIVLASPYMPGGRVEDVPFARLVLSRVGNWVLRRALSQSLYTSTGIVRAYRAPVLRSLDLSANGKEIHLEILSQAIALGYRIVEMPSVLRTRRAGRSKFRPRATILSHLLFSLIERSASVLSAVGLMFLGASLALGAYLFGVYLTGGLNPERPLMTVMIVLFLGGATILSFSVLAVQMLVLRRDVVRLHADVKVMRAAVEGESAEELILEPHDTL
ncbi:MAG: glycosyltransferase [Coriobacteriia bacterium]|nr:glycosyltransferase [Coriobacteriia bacterium]